MTRINSSIPVKHLTDEHLLAEHREIKRLPACYLKAIKSGSLKKIPKKFCLGTGHVTFFLDKFKFTYERYKIIHEECLFRGFNVLDYSSLWDNVKSDFNWKPYITTDEENNLLIQRISERIENSTKKSFHYNSKIITKEDAISLLKN